MVLIRTALARPVPRLNLAQNVRFRGGRAGSISMPMRPQQSHRIAVKELNALPADMGLLPGLSSTLQLAAARKLTAALLDTFIMPTGKNLPSLISSPSLRFLLERRRAYQRLMDLREYVGAGYTAGCGG